MAERWITADGTESSDREDAIRVSPSEIVRAWIDTGTLIPARFALGSAKHETGYAINNLTIERNGVRTVGLFQLGHGDDEPAATDPTLLTLQGSCSSYARICESRLERLCQAAGLPTDNVEALPPDIWAFLAVAHNVGPGAAQNAIKIDECSWASFKERHDEESDNPLNVAIVREKGGDTYGDDCITGGSDWSAAFEFMTERQPEGDTGDGNSESGSADSLGLWAIALVAGAAFLAVWVNAK